MTLGDRASQRSGGRDIIVPSDLLVREFDAKLLFACAAAERGFSAIVGSKFEIFKRLHEWPVGCYIHKDVHSKPGLLRRLRQAGHQVLAWDEEGLVNVSRQRYLQMRVSGDVLDSADALFAWGRENAQAWQECPGFHGTPIHITGNPRGDLLRPELRGYFEDEAQELRQRFGPFVLLNTNFGFVNSYINKSVFKIQAEKRSQIVNADGFMDGFIAFRGRIFEQFLAIVPHLADAIGGSNLIIRPHPTEDHDAWRRAAGGRGNVQVVHEGNVTPWLMAASAVVHNGCSTGLEAHLLGRPAVAYCPLTSDTYDIPLPNAVSHQAASLDDLVDTVRAALAGSLAVDGGEADRRRREIEQNIAGMDQALASDRILDVMQALAGAGAGLWRRTRQQLLSWFSARPARPEQRADATRDAIKRPRFPDTSVDSVRQRIAKLRGCMNRFHDVDALELAPNVFRVARY